MVRIKRGKRRRALGLLPALAVLAAVTLRPEAAVSAALEGLRLCFTVIVPSLFPFFALSSMLCELGLPALLGRLAGPLTSRLFNVSGEGAAAFIIGVTGGYPLGAAAVADIYRRGGCSKGEAERMLAFCNNSGPAFILGVAGAGVFGSAGAGALLYLAHILAAVLTGYALRGGKNEKRPAPPRFTQGVPEGFAAVFTRCVKSSFAACLNISAFVVFFSVLVGLLRQTGLVAALTDTPLAASLLTGFFELGGGIASLKGLSGTGALCAAAFLLGWGGLSVHAQVMAVTGDTDLRLTKHFAGRALHGLISAGLTAVGCLFFTIR